jgi:hypothetical protein
MEVMRARAMEGDDREQSGSTKRASYRRAVRHRDLDEPFASDHRESPVGRAQTGVARNSSPRRDPALERSVALHSHGVSSGGSYSHRVSSDIAESTRFDLSTAALRPLTRARRGDTCT